MFLTAADVAHLTGRKTRRRQIDALRAMGVPFLVNARGWPVDCRVRWHWKRRTSGETY